MIRSLLLASALLATSAHAQDEPTPERERVDIALQLELSTEDSGSMCFAALDLLMSRGLSLEDGLLSLHTGDSIDPRICAYTLLLEQLKVEPKDGVRVDGISLAARPVDALTAATSPSSTDYCPAIKRLLGLCQIPRLPE
jgi:hypothetical protein